MRKNKWLGGELASDLWSAKENAISYEDFEDVCIEIAEFFRDIEKENMQLKARLAELESESYV